MFRLFFLILLLNYIFVACQNSQPKANTINIEREFNQLKSLVQEKLSFFIKRQLQHRFKYRETEVYRAPKVSLDIAIGCFLLSKYAWVEEALDSSNSVFFDDLKSKTAHKQGITMGNTVVLSYVNTINAAGGGGVLTKIYFLYNPYKKVIYPWIPIEWANYIVHVDSTKIKKDYEWQEETIVRKKTHSVYPFVYYMSVYKDDYERAKEEQKKHIAQLKKNEKIREYCRFYNCAVLKTPTDSFKAYSMREEEAFRLLDTVVAQVPQYTVNGIDTLLSYLHNPSFYTATQGFDYTGQCYIEGIAKDSLGQPYLEVLEDTLQWLFGTPYISNVFERVTVEDIRNTQLHYPDYTTEGVGAVANYAEKRRPTLMYFKRISSFVRDDTAYYFLFYYLDYHWFWGWRLRDLEVVFPRRFLAQ